MRVDPLISAITGRLTLALVAASLAAACGNTGSANDAAPPSDSSTSTDGSLPDARATTDALLDRTVPPDSTPGTDSGSHPTSDAMSGNGDGAVPTGDVSC